MKSKILYFILTLFCVPAVFGFVGCNDNANIKPPPGADNAAILTVITLGTRLLWNKIGRDVDYEVYCNGELADTVQTETYRFSELPSDAECYVIAKEGKDNCVISNTVTVFSDRGFAESEVLVLSDMGTYNTLIASTVRKVCIYGTVSLNLQIESRKSDLYFELNNADIFGCIKTSDGGFSRTKHDFSVIFDVTGNCSIRGADGANGFDFSDARYDNGEQNAGVGGNGEEALLLPSVIIHSDGNLTVSGGNGGNGGKGSATTTWEGSKTPGKGSNGGNGGAAVKTSYFVMDMGSSAASVKIIDGKGGSKGMPGNNGSLITGPLVSAMWSDVYDIGKYGNDGKSELGTKKLYKGNLYY